MYSSEVLLFVAAIIILVLVWMLRRNRKMSDWKQAWDQVAFNESLAYERSKMEREKTALREQLEARNQQEIRGYQARICRLQVNHQDATESAVRKAVALTTALHEVDMKTSEQLLRRKLGRERGKLLGKLISEREQEAIHLAQHGQFKDAYALLNEVLGLAVASGCASSKASALFNLAILLGFANDDFEQAISLIQEAIRLVESHEHTDACPPRVAGAQTRDERLATYRRHLEEYEHKFLLEQCATAQSEGLMLLRAGEAWRAVRYFQAAIDLAVQADSPFLRFGNTVNLATALGNCDRFEQAYGKLEEARKIAVTLGADAENLIALVDQSKFNIQVLKQSKPFKNLMKRVQFHGRRENHVAAERVAREALGEALKTFGPRHYLTAEAFDQIGVALAKQEKFDAAIRNLEVAVDIASEWEHTASSLGSRAMRNLAALREAMGEE